VKISEIQMCGFGNYVSLVLIENDGVPGIDHGIDLNNGFN
jgi:hypothetical protein